MFNTLHNLSVEASRKILSELDSRGFYTDSAENATGLVNIISEIIENTIQGNTNITVVPPTAEPDGWEGDLVNQ